MTDDSGSRRGFARSVRTHGIITCPLTTANDGSVTALLMSAHDPAVMAIMTLALIVPTLISLSIKPLSTSLVVRSFESALCTEPDHHQLQLFQKVLVF